MLGCVHINCCGLARHMADVPGCWMWHLPAKSMCYSTCCGGKHAVVRQEARASADHRGSCMFKEIQ